MLTFFNLIFCDLSHNSLKKLHFRKHYRSILTKQVRKVNSDLLLNVCFWNFINLINVVEAYFGRDAIHIRLGIILENSEFIFVKLHFLLISMSAIATFGRNNFIQKLSQILLLLFRTSLFLLCLMFPFKMWKFGWKWNILTCLICIVHLYFHQRLHVWGKFFLLDPCRLSVPPNQAIYIQCQFLFWSIRNM